MSAFAIELQWQRAEPALETGKFFNAHAVTYNSGHELRVDAAPDRGGNLCPFCDAIDLTDQSLHA